MLFAKPTDYHLGKNYALNHRVNGTGIEEKILRYLKKDKAFLKELEM